MDGMGSWLQTFFFFLFDLFDFSFVLFLCHFGEVLSGANDIS